MYPRPNPLKARLAADEHILGLFVQTPSPDAVEIAAAAGFHYAIIDLEHGSFGLTEALAMIRAAEASGICPLVRVPDQSPAMLRRVVEAGAMGVYVPDVRTADQARAAIAALRFKAGHNGGTRGACPTARAARPRNAGWHDFVRWSNDELMVCLLVESAQGLRNLDEILGVPGIDTIVLGRFDLWHELGLEGDRYHEEIDRIFEDFASRARAAGVRYATRLSSLEHAAAREQWQAAMARGERVFTLGSDRQLLLRAFEAATAPMAAGPGVAAAQKLALRVP
ncbi:aldolase/citrate lyase family protein [Aquincola sp. MAHUQ-54]|uniref:Aldolase/citrate lyase family protein n=1 Tax=Aquincola agrisoli TaxID=3119538 RepID=A0AAW9QCS1_9BURK